MSSMPLDYETIQCEPKSACSSTTSTLLEQDLAVSSSSDSEIEFIDEDTTTNHQKFNQDLTIIMTETPQFKSCQSYINKMKQHFDSIEKIIKAEPECAMCAYHCFALLDELSKNSASRPGSKK